MIRFNKKLYYKYFDLFRMSSFLQDSYVVKRSYAAMQIIKKAYIKVLNLSNKELFRFLDFDQL